jgi:glycyl-tRNA synthetase alpha chain
MQKIFYFQDIIMALNHFWMARGCTLLQPYDTEVGAGTLHPATALGAIGNKAYNIAYVQPSRRPKDSRFGENPNRLGHYYQYQVLLKPAPIDIQDICLASFEAIGIDTKSHDIRFVEDDWENPTIGAWGLGWEVWCDGMEILQFTFMQQIGGIDCGIIPAELTYGLERLAMYIQDIDHFQDIQWNENVTYADIFMNQEKQFSEYFLNQSSVEFLLNDFKINYQEAKHLLEQDLPLVAYHFCLKTCHVFNMIDARGAISVTERAHYIANIRELARNCIQKAVELKI